MLAIIQILEEWPAERLQWEGRFDILTDHKTLEYFMTTKKLNARQALLRSRHTLQPHYVQYYMHRLPYSIWLNVCPNFTS
jgi:RNase H-like domain found in reverse transcriptase